jgi:hypothetical protein
MKKATDELSQALQKIGESLYNEKKSEGGTEEQPQDKNTQ